MKRQSTTARLLRSINRSAVLDLVRSGAPFSRADLARRLDLSLPTVIRVVDELAADGLVRESGAVVSTGGRPGALVEFAGAASTVIGVDIGGTKMMGAVADLCGHVVYEEYCPHPPDATPDDFLQELYGLVERLLQATVDDGRRVRGVGVGVPAAVTVPAGIVQWAPALGWRDLPLRALLSQRFRLPVFVENDVNLMTLGELGFGAGRGLKNLAVIAVGTGIGAGVVVGGALYRGAHQLAGEIGYLPPGVVFLGRRYPGFGALEGLASGAGIAQRAIALAGTLDLPISAEELSTAGVFAAARDGVAWASQLVAETVDYLALAIASLSVVLDPELVVLGGGLAGSADLLVDPICARLEGVLLQMPPLVPSLLGRNAAALGAIMLVLHGTAEAVVVQQVV
jgi:predicted NBD/HSP70 family sugar kinase